MSKLSSKPCPCGFDAPYSEHCGALHDNRAAASTAEQLMRSRYSAFVVQDAPYLLRSWAAATRPAELTFDLDLEWTGLEILDTTGGSAFHTEGTVEFRAHFRHAGTADSQQENSHFLRESGLWVYVAPV
jgi:SEC-C motif-containing protein